MNGGGGGVRGALKHLPLLFCKSVQFLNIPLLLYILRLIKHEHFFGSPGTMCIQYLRTIYPDGFGGNAHRGTR